MPRYIGLEWTDRPKTCTYEHEQIITALASGDAEGARAAMFEHLTQSRDMLSEDLARSGLWD